MRMMNSIDLRYIHLQKALKEISPYLTAIEKYKKPIYRESEGKRLLDLQGKPILESVDEWSPETYEYVDSWIKQAVKKRPSSTDVLVENLLNNTIAPILRKSGVKVGHRPWYQIQKVLSTGVHTGALAGRVKNSLRNLVQSSFDWTMYGTKTLCQKQLVRLMNC